MTKCVSDKLEESSLEFFRASVFIKAGRNEDFAKLIVKSYLITDGLCKDYPMHCEHFFGKCVPGILRGEREIISGYINGEVVATAFLKKDKAESKIGTLYVKPEYRRQGIGTALIEECFEWLGTTKPLVTIADYKLAQLAKFIKRYDWLETQVLEAGYYNNHSREHVFNGVIEQGFGFRVMTPVIGWFLVLCGIMVI